MTFLGGNWKPRSKAQELALASIKTELLLIGGAAGSLKSETLLVDAMQEYRNPNFRGILFRTTYPETEQLIARSRILFGNLGGTYIDQCRTWKWPWGATFRFGYLATERDLYAHQGQQYSWIAFDESTHRTEKEIRYILSRLRSVDPFLNLRCRLASNPGGRSHVEHMHIFLGGVCPHCQPWVRRPGQLYRDATWKSDNKPIEMTTKFIFGRLTDHDLLPGYEKQVRMQSGANAKALLEGCWRAFEGQYFDIWEPNRAGSPMVVPRQTINDQYYWVHWIAADYGFSGSKSVAYLFAMSPDGVIYVLDEYVAAGERVHPFANSVYDRFARKRDGQEQARHINAMYLSPDCFSDRGDPHSLALQMNEVLEPHGLAFTKAKNDRVGGASLIYTMLQEGRLVVSSSCKLLRQSLETRIHDPKEPDDVLKVIGSELDDAYDAARYGVYSYQEPEEKPRELRIAEAVRGLDATMAMIRMRQMEAELDSEEDVLYWSPPSARRVLREIERRNRSQWY